MEHLKGEVFGFVGNMFNDAINSIWILFYSNLFHPFNILKQLKLIQLGFFCCCCCIAIYAKRDCSLSFRENISVTKCEFSILFKFPFILTVRNINKNQKSFFISVYLGKRERFKSKAKNFLILLNPRERGC